MSDIREMRKSLNKMKIIMGISIFFFLILYIASLIIILLNKDKLDITDKINLLYYLSNIFLPFIFYSVPRRYSLEREIKEMEKDDKK